MASFVVSVFLLVSCAALCAQAPVAIFSGVQRSFPNPATYPYGLAVDKSGNIFVADNDYDSVSEIPYDNGAYAYSSVLGSFQQPWGIAVDGSDNVYIVENGADDVIKLTATPTPYGNAYTASVLPTSGLGSPYGVAVDGAGNVYITDGGNGRIVKLTPQGNTYIQSTLPTGARGFPMGIAVDSAGNVYFSDLAFGHVLKETPTGNGYTETTVADNLPYEPVGVAVDGSGNVYILCFLLGGSDTYSVLKETPVVGGYAQSPVGFSPYQNPYGIAADVHGNVFIDSPSLSGLVELSPVPADFGMVNVAGPGASFTIIFTFDGAATLGTPRVATQGVPALDFTDAGSGSCTYHGGGNFFNPGDSCSLDVNFRPQFPGLRKGAATLLDTAGNSLGAAYVAGTGVAPQVTFPPGRQTVVDTGLGRPKGVALDSAGNVFVADSQDGVVYKESAGGNSRAIIASGLNHPTAVAIDGAGSLFVATANGLYQETALAGSYTQKALITNLANLTGVAVDGDGSLYLTSSASGNVHKETLSIAGSYTETAVGFGISHPGGVTVDGNGTVFVADPQQGTVYKESPAANGVYEQATVAAGLEGPENLAVDGGGNLYITSSQRGTVYRETPVSGGGYVQSIAASLSQPWGIGLDSRGNLYISQGQSGGGLLMVDVSDPPILNFDRASVGSTSPDSPQLVTLANIGNAALDIPVLSHGDNPSITPGFTVGASSTCPALGLTGADGSLAANNTCGYEISYTPVVPGPVRGAAVITDTSLNTLAAQRIELRQGITSDATRVSLRVTPDQIKKGLGVTLTATVADTSVASIVPTGGGVTFTDTVQSNETVLNGGKPVPLSGGKAVLQILPSAGEHTIIAHYSGVDAAFVGSTAQALLAVYKD